MPVFMFVCVWGEGIAVPRTFSFILQRITKKLSCEVACLGSNTTFIYIKDYFPQTRHLFPPLWLSAARMCQPSPRSSPRGRCGSFSSAQRQLFSFLKKIDIVSRLHLENHFTTESNKWQMECCCFSFSPLLPLFLSLWTDCPLHSHGEAVPSEGRHAPLAASLQFNYGALVGLISIPRSGSSLSDR